MEQDERDRWNQRYKEDSHSSREPDVFLIEAYSEFLASKPPGVALDVAGGAGRHALWLAQRGWQVRLIDISETGIALAKESAQALLESKSGSLPGRTRGLIEARQFDLRNIRDLGHEQYDLVMVFDYLQRRLFPAILAALRPGGWLIYKTYTIGQLRLSGGPRHPDYLLQPGELRQAFSAMRVLLYREAVAAAATAELVAEKIA